MIPGFDLVQFTNTAGPIAAIIVVALIIFAESGLLIGFFLPGDSILFTLGFLLQSMGKIPFGLNINSVVLLLFIAAVAGDSLGYLTGRKIGPYLFKRPNSLLFKQKNVAILTLLFSGVLYAVSSPQARSRGLPAALGRT